MGSFLFPFDVSLSNVLSATITGCIFGLTISYVTLAIQALNGKKGFALAIGSCFVGISYIFYVLSGLSANLDSLKYVSIFSYYDGPGVLVNGLNATSLIVMVGLLAICFITALYGFKRRDIGV